MRERFLDKMFWVKALFFVLAVLTGGAAMAVEIGGNGSDTDPNDGKPLENATPDAAGKGIDQQGQGATGSAVTDADLAENKVEDYVSKFQAYKYPMHTDFLKLAKQVHVNTKEPEHYNIGEAIMDCVTKAAVTNTDKDAEVKLSLYKNDEKLFAECNTVLVDGVTGYDEAGNSDGSPLVLYVVSADKANGIMVAALNGPLDDSGNMYVPDLKAGTGLHIMAPAMSESEVEIAPDSAYPKKEIAYLQKKVCPITWTEFFERINKKAKWNVQDLKDWTLSNFRKKCTRTMLIGVGTKSLKYGSKKTGTEYVYFQKGVLRQLRLGYQIGSTLEFADLIGITRMLFGKYSNTNEMDVYCGTKFIEKLLNIDFTKHKDISFVKKQNIGIDISSFETTFGKLNFKVEHALDDLGYEECAVAFPMSEAKRYYYQKGKTLTVDHSKGEGGEVREAKSQYYIQDDCLMLTGYNSMMIGPDVTVSGYKLSMLDTVVSSVASLSSVSTPKKDDVVYLTVADDTHAVGLYVYDGTAWKPYKGEINV